MNAIDTTRADVAPTELYRRALGALRWTGLLQLVLFGGLAGLWGVAPFVSNPVLAGLRGTRLVPIGLAALTLSLAGVAGAAVLTSARLRALEAAWPGGRRRWRFRGASGDPARVGQAARWPQVLIVAPLAVLAGVLAGLPPGGDGAASSAVSAMGGVAVLLAFPLLVAERVFAAMPAVRLPEAQAVRRLLLVPVVAWPAAGLVQIAGGLGVAIAPALDAGVAAVLAVAAAEVALRAAGRGFLPPPGPGDARAAVDALLPRLLAEGLAERGVAAPVRTHLGIDFSRSWALGFVRRAALPVVAGLALLSWGLSGVVLLGMDSRGIYERFGAPVAVLGPGVHAILPWPMGRVRRLEYGVLHEISPEGGEAGAVATASAEGPAPAEADRLWEQAHPAEQVLVVASGAPGRAGGQSFQVVSADIRLRYRIGLSDGDALRAAYAAAEPEALLRGVAGRVIAGFAAGQTLEALLGGNRERLGEQLRAAIQARLDADATGLEVSAVVIEAIHPPAGAAEAYHAVQAAEIMANASVAAERGRAFSTRAHARQYAADLAAQAQAAGAEAVATAAADTASFVADRDAAAAHPVAFALERRLAALAAGLGKSSLTIIDRRVAGAKTTLDLRPMTPSTATSTPPNAE
ncbi:MAG: SPFH domain-containing protein [Acetobacteraceae bacterium]|nr:SPFH domain-containing protein [Acetobacteraceae bacterium]